jgi:hypothetical protein
MLWRTFHRLCDRNNHHDASVECRTFACCPETRASICAGMIFLASSCLM